MAMVLNYLLHLAELALQSLLVAVFLFILLRNYLKQFVPPKPSAARIVFFIDGKEFTEMRNIKDNEQIPLSVLIEDAKNAVLPDAQFDADPAPSWGLTNSAAGVLEVAADGKSAIFKAGLAGEVTQVQFSGSVGGKALNGLSEELTVTPGDADHVEIKLGDNAPQA